MMACRRLLLHVQRRVSVSHTPDAYHITRWPPHHEALYSSSTTNSRTSPTALGRVINLPDGRQLGYHEFGDPNGAPVIYIHGSPDSGITLSGFEGPVAKRLGVRWIAPDRPGIGLSTFQPNRRVTDYPDDLSCLIEQLSLRQYRILGTSGGTGYTLACAQQLPRKDLLSVGICAGVGPCEAGLTGQSQQVQLVMGYWKDHPEAMVSLMEDIFLLAAQDPDPAKMEAKWVEQLEKSFDSQDRKVLMMPNAIQSAVKVFRQVYAHGGAAHGHEMKLNTEPWGFDIKDINYEGILLWYGAMDANTSPEMGRYMAQRLPRAIYKEYPGETHYSIWREELVSEFLRHLLKLA